MSGIPPNGSGASSASTKANVAAAKKDAAAKKEAAFHKIRDAFNTSSGTTSSNTSTEDLNGLGNNKRPLPVDHTRKLTMFDDISYYGIDETVRYDATFNSY